MSESNVQLLIWLVVYFVVDFVSLAGMPVLLRARLKMKRWHILCMQDKISYYMNVLVDLSLNNRIMYSK